MHYTIVGLRETGELACYDRVAAKPTPEKVEQICNAYGYVQVLVLANVSGGYFQRYEYDREPRLRVVPPLDRREEEARDDNPDKR